MYTACIITFTHKHVCVQTILHNINFSECIQVESSFMNHICLNGLMKTSSLDRRIQVAHKHVHTFIKVNDVSMIP